MNWLSVEHNGRLYLVPEFVVDALKAAQASNARFVEWMRGRCECCECDSAVNWTISKALLGESA